MLTLPRCVGRQCSMRANCSAVISITAVSPLSSHQHQ
jgi:hypothetical protein